MIAPHSVDSFPMALQAVTFLLRLHRPRGCRRLLRHHDRAEPTRNRTKILGLGRWQAETKQAKDAY